MKNFFLSIFAVAAIVLLSQSCNKKIDLIGDFEESAIIYGLLDKADSVQYIKITRAFIGPGNSLNIAQIADSNYFNNVDATVKEYVGGTLTRTWTLSDTLIQNKDENGVFYGPEQRLYVFYTPSGQELLDNATYKLDVDVNNGEFQVSGETEIVSGIYTNTDAASYSFKFAKNASEYKSTTINVNAGNSYVINTTLELHYDEFIGAVSAPNSLFWKLGETDITPGTTKPFVANGQTFYEQIANKCANADPLIDKRNFTGITVRVVGGAEDLYNYMLVNQPSSSLAQNKPTFTNLTATNNHRVVGIFSSRFTFEAIHEFSTPASQFIRCLDKSSTEVLCIGSITGLYLFCSQHDQDLFPVPESWACN